jgi:two-component system sensor histidine kinase ChvG
MALATDSPKAEPEDTALRWSGRLSLRRRILAVNILPVILLAGSFFYLDSIRSRLVAERLLQAQSETRLMATILGSTPQDQRATELGRLAHSSGSRLRLYVDNDVKFDSWRGESPNFSLADPAEESWERKLAALLDDVIDGVVGASAIPRFHEFPNKPPPSALIQLADDRTHVITASAPIPGNQAATLVTDRNVRDIRRLVRAERSRLGMIVGFSTLASILLSLFLARTIVRPLQRLALASEQVRLGRAREVVIPRLPSRSDEIGALARALSDMTETLRERIDATEAFAADVAHELKNPLASLSSALETMASVADPKLKQQLMAIANDDVRRLDRLITDISEASRLDAQLTRTTFIRVDLGQLLERLLAEREARGANNGIKIAFARPQRGSATVLGDPGRLARTFENLIDNAISFSPPDGVVRITATCSDEIVIATVEDDGPGVPAASREAIFDRFHSDRPEGEEFGRHSGLGLAIARTIVEGHNGTIEVRERSSEQSGALFVVTLPAAR